MNYEETSMDTFQSDDGTVFDVHLWEPEKPRLIFLGLHGALAHAGDFVNVGKYYLEHGIATVSYDLRGHKQKRIHAKSLEQILDDNDSFLSWVKQKYPEIPIVVVGHSFGGLLALISALQGWDDDEMIIAYVVSSPYLGNAVKVSPILIRLSKLLGKLMPKAKVPVDSITHLLTHDEKIYQRHIIDEEKNIRATEVSMRFATIFLAGQGWIDKNIQNWKSPLYAVLAGQDKVSDTAYCKKNLDKIDQKLVNIVVHQENYHENFNELNREDTFKDILVWINKVN